MHAAGHGGAARRACGDDARDVLRGFDDSFLFFEDDVVRVSCVAEVEIGEHGAPGLKAERNLEGARHAAHGDQGGCDQQGADGDLRSEQQVTQGKATKGCGFRWSAFHRLEGTALPGAAGGEDAEEQRAGESEGEACEVEARVDADGQMAVG